MDDFDELMGPISSSRKKMVEASISVPTPAVISPDPSPVSRSSTGPPRAAFGRSSGPPSSAFGGRSSGPPSTAFTNNTSPRWNQYEKDDDTFRAESSAATGKAVFSAAVRAADRMASDFDVEERMSNAGASLPNAEEIRGTSGSRTSGGFSFNSSSRRKTEEKVVHNTHDRVRAEALQLLEKADEFSPPNRTPSGGFSTDPVPTGKRVPSKLSGMDFRTSGSARAVSRTTAPDGRYTIDDVEVDEDDVVEVVHMEKNIGRQSTSSNADSSTSSWSSRYNVNQSLMALTSGGYSDNKGMKGMNSKEEQRLEQSARNMFRTSPHQATQPKVFGSGFSFTGGSYFNKKETTTPKNMNLKTVWMDVDLQSNGRSLQAPEYHRGPASLERSRKRRRICVGTIIVVALIAILASVLGSTLSRRSSASALTDPNAVKFYVTADVPYDMNQEAKIIRDLETIPVDADFIVHLGNIQDASVTLCPQQAYIGAKAILKASPVTVFALPGPNDWNNCPNPGVALSDWKDNLGNFERNFVHHFGVTHQLGNEENFAFLEKGVLFIGLHLVGGRKVDKEEWRLRHAKNARWVEEQLSNVSKDKYRALVFLANARPSQQHEDFFSEIFDDVNSLKKPVLYVHANAGSGQFEQYKPFTETSGLMAIQVASGGTNPPLKVAIGEGSSPFAFASS